MEIRKLKNKRLLILIYRSLIWWCAAKRKKVQENAGIYVSGQRLSDFIRHDASLDYLSSKLPAARVHARRKRKNGKFQLLSQDDLHKYPHFLWQRSQFTKLKI